MLVALSDTAVGGIFSLGVAAVAAVGGILTVVLTHQSREQNRAAEKTATDFEESWRDRGELLDGFQHDFALALQRIAQLEQDRDASLKREKASLEREQNCLEALQLSAARIAVLEERLGVTAGE